MIIKKIMTLQKPFAIMMIATRLGDDWFAIMEAKDCEKVTGFHESRSFKGLCECDLDSDDVEVFRGIRNQFVKTYIDKNVYVFNRVGSDFRSYYKRPQTDRLTAKKQLLKH